MSKRIPLYDATAAIACTISDAEVPDRIAIVERLHAAATSVHRTDRGLLLDFAHDDATRADLAQFVVDEQRCCQFWGFEVVDAGDRVALHWEGPPEVAAVLDELYAYFTGAAPMPSVRGLL